MPRQVVVSRSGQRYEFDNSTPLGSGHFSHVFRCVRVSDSKGFALKVIDRSMLKESGDAYFEALRNEIKVQKLMSSSAIPFFVGLEEFFENESSVFMVLELCDGTLGSPESRPERQSLRDVFQVGLALAFLHSNSLMHCDVKPENLFRKAGQAKLGDFGMSCTFSAAQRGRGSLFFLAPESFSAQFGQLTAKVDVWALNACLFFLLFGYHAFRNSDPSRQPKLVCQEKFDPPSAPQISPQTLDLLARGFIKDPLVRPSILDYLAHPAFDSVRSEFANYFARLRNISTTQSPSQIGNPENSRLAPLLCFRNNLLLFSDLSAWVIETGINAVFALLLIKRQAQETATLLLGLGSKAQITSEPHRTLLTQIQPILASPGLRKIIALLSRDLKIVTKTFASLRGRLARASEMARLDLPSQRLEDSCGQKYEKFLKDFLQNLYSSGKVKISPELEAMVMKIMDYELHDRLCFLTPS